MTKFQSTWTDDVSNIAQSMWQDGYSATIIASVIGKSRSSVVSRMKRLGVVRAEGLPVLGADRIPAKTISRNGLPPRPAPAPRPVKPSRPATVPSQSPVMLADLLKHHCRAIPGEVLPNGLTLYCGDPKAEGSSYCPFHHAAYTQPLKERIAHGQTGQRHEPV
jgi:hypothetical protein